MTSRPWHIGTMRPEEARVHDTWEGYHSFHAEPLAEGEPAEPYGSFEIFWHDGGAYDAGQPDAEGEDMALGWYWWACFPGCLPDGEPSGPFATSRDVLEDADEWNPEFDE